MAGAALWGAAAAIAAGGDPAVDDVAELDGVDAVAPSGPLVDAAENESVGLSVRLPVASGEAGAVAVGVGVDAFATSRGRIDPAMPITATAHRPTVATLADTERTTRTRT